MNTFDNILVDGYRIGGVSFGYVEPMLGGQDGAGDAKSVGGKINGLALRYHGLEGGEIHLFINPDNQVSGAESYRYATKCFVDRVAMETGENKIGKIVLRRMDMNGTLAGEITVALEPLDEQHLLDRLVGEVLHWHARDFGPGPFATARQSSRPKAAV